jgi:hypothetical protein
MLGRYDWQGSATFRANGRDYAVQEFLAGCTGSGSVVAPPKPKVVTRPPAPPTFYRLRLHDTLSKVAAMFHTTVYLLRAWNYRTYPILRTRIDRLFVGWRLRIRGPKNARLPAVVRAKPKPKPVPVRWTPRHPLIEWGGLVEHADRPYLPRHVLVLGR